MANIKISELAPAGSANGTMEYEVNDAFLSKKVTGAQISAYVLQGKAATAGAADTAAACTGNSATATTAASCSGNAATATTATMAKQVPVSATTGTLVAADTGKCAPITAGLTVPASVFAAGDVVSVVNDGATALTITQDAGLTMYLSSTAATGNRTLAARGIATIWFKSPTVAYISGAGLT